MFAGLSLIAALAILFGSAAAVWLAGLWLTDTTDALDSAIALALYVIGMVGFATFAGGI